MLRMLFVALLKPSKLLLKSTTRKSALFAISLLQIKIFACIRTELQLTTNVLIMDNRYVFVLKLAKISKKHSEGEELLLNIFFFLLFIFLTKKIIYIKLRVILILHMIKINNINFQYPSFDALLLLIPSLLELFLLKSEVND